MGKIEALSTVTKIDPEQGLVEVEVIANYNGVIAMRRVRWEDMTHEAAYENVTQRKLYFDRKVFGCDSETLKPRPEFYRFTVAPMGMSHIPPVDMIDDQTDFPAPDEMEGHGGKIKARLNIKKSKDSSLFLHLISNIQLASVFAVTSKGVDCSVSSFQVTVEPSVTGGGIADALRCGEIDFYATNPMLTYRSDGNNRVMPIFEAGYAIDPVLEFAKAKAKAVNETYIPPVCEVCGWIHDETLTRFDNPKNPNETHTIQFDFDRHRFIKAVHEGMKSSSDVSITPIIEGLNKTNSPDSKDILGKKLHRILFISTGRDRGRIRKPNEIRSAGRPKKKK